MRFEAFSFGSICIDGVTYEHDMVIDHGIVRKRKKKPSKPLADDRRAWGRDLPPDAGDGFGTALKERTARLRPERVRSLAAWRDHLTGRRSQNSRFSAAAARGESVGGDRHAYLL
ncbi:hypothetical protein CNECB9_3430031 [Cupriavidus necator]|uniref:Uncharacterized protein n=1 Tax=Cupriavidus necator TaxID=106590 RepID=A0A1K0IIB5_CUPNE|nr:hypothetical protein CNECB9_3430031 [Cupriavidus necator]